MIFPWENKHDSHRTFVPVCPREKFMNWPFFGLPGLLLILAILSGSDLRKMCCDPNSQRKINLLGTGSPFNKTERAKALRPENGSCELNLHDPNQTCINSRTAGEPCEPNLRIENAANCDLGALSTTSPQQKISPETNPDRKFWCHAKVPTQ